MNNTQQNANASANLGLKVSASAWKPTSQGKPLNPTGNAQSNFNVGAGSFNPPSGGQQQQMSTPSFTPNQNTQNTQKFNNYTGQQSSNYNNFQQNSAQMPAPPGGNQQYNMGGMNMQYGQQQQNNMMYSGHQQQYNQQFNNGYANQSYNNGYQQQQQQTNYNGLNNMQQYGGQNQGNYQNNQQPLYNQNYNKQNSFKQGGGQHYQNYNTYQVKGKNGHQNYRQNNGQMNGGQQRYNEDFYSNKPTMDYKSKKIQNVPTSTINTGHRGSMSANTPAFKPSDGGLKLNAALFVPGQPKPATPPPPPVDPIVEKLKKVGETEEEQVKLFKDLQKQKEEQKEEIICLEFFKKVGELKMCQSKEKTPEEMKHSVYPILLEREVKLHYELSIKRGNRDGRGGRGRGGRGGHYGGGGHTRNYNNDGNDEGDFSKGGAKPMHQHQHHRHKQDWNQGGWKQEDSEEKAKLKEKALAMQAKVKMVKNESQKIRLILNVITPDNFAKKFKELRAYQFGELKTRNECEEDGIEYDEKIHLLGDNINKETLNVIVQNIFRKAQLEKEYCIFYGQLVEQFIKLEIELKGQVIKQINLKISEFRKSLFEVCRVCFEKFFSAEEKAKHANDKEKELVFQQKLFGNINFVGELYRRRILPENILVNVFMSLQGTSEENTETNDLIIEAAIKLMNKVGQKYEENIESSAKKRQKNQEQFNSIMSRFTELMEDTDGTKFGLSNRIRLLVKNMFDNKESGWQKTKDANENGPKTKAEVQQEVEDKYAKEQQARDHGHHGRYNDNRRGGDRNYNDDRRRNDRDGGQQKYRQKDGGQRYQQRDRDYNRHNEDDNEESQRGGTYGKGGREDRRDNRDNRRTNERREVQVVELPDEEMGELLKKNFEEYAQKQEMAAQGVEEEDEEEAKNDSNDKKFDSSLYKKLRYTNGKQSDLIFYSLLTKVFDEDMKKIEKHLEKYLDKLVQNRTFQKKDLSNGISRFIQFLPELVIDVPLISKYLYTYVIKPLMTINQLDLKFIRWSIEPEKKDPEDEDDILFDGTDSYFKLMAYILVDHSNSGSWKETVSYYNENNWNQVSKDKHEKIEEKDDLWDQIKSEIGDKAAQIVIPLLNQDKTDSQKNQQVLEKALKTI